MSSYCSICIVFLVILTPCFVILLGYIVPVEVLKRMLEDFDSADTVTGGGPVKLRGFARFVPLLQGLENNA